MAPSCDLCAAPAHRIDHSRLLPLLPQLPALPDCRGWPCLLTLPDPGTPRDQSPLCAAAAGATRSTPGLSWLGCQGPSPRRRARLSPAGARSGAGRGGLAGLAMGSPPLQGEGGLEEPRRRGWQAAVSGGYRDGRR